MSWKRMWDDSKQEWVDVYFEEDAEPEHSSGSATSTVTETDEAPRLLDRHGRPIVKKRVMGFRR